jgi:hypothetical protein
MARNTPLSQVVAQLKAELGYNLVPGVGSADDNRLAMLVDQKQAWLGDSYDFPFLENTWSINVGVGNRYLNLPTVDDAGDNVTINLERPHYEFVFWAGAFQAVEYGIREEDYNENQSQLIQGVAPQPLDPIQRWRWYFENQFEVWPIPASNQVFRFRGQATVPSMITYTQGVSQPAVVQPQWQATLALDDQMVVLFAAAEELLLKGKANAKQVLDRANARIQYLRANYPKRTQDVSFSGNRFKQFNNITGIKQILVAGNFSNK